MKKCTDCGQTKVKDEFSVNKSKKDGLNYRCKVCQNKYFKEYYKKNKKKHLKAVRKRNKRVEKELKSFIDSLKQKPCLDCGVQYPPCVMDFDHVTGTKKFAIAMAARLGASKKKVLKEIQKCELVCANCHRIRTHIGR